MQKKADCKTLLSPLLTGRTAVKQQHRADAGIPLFCNVAADFLFDHNGALLLL